MTYSLFLPMDFKILISYLGASDLRRRPLGTAQKRFLKSLEVNVVPPPRPCDATAWVHLANQSSSGAGLSFVVAEGHPSLVRGGGASAKFISRRPLLPRTHRLRC